MDDSLESKIENVQPVQPIANYVPEPILVTTLRGDILYANSATVDMFGYSIDEMRGKNISLMNDSVFQSKQKDITFNILLTGTYAYELNPVTKSGERLIVSITSSKIEDYAGVPAFIHTVRDITEKRNLHLQIGATNKLLAQKNKELQDSLEAQTTFISIMGHDLRAPYTAILGFSHIIHTEINELSREDIAEYSKIINSSARSSLELIDEILTLTKVRSGNMSPEHELFKPEDIIDSVVEFSKAGYEHKNISLKKIYTGIGKIYADRFMVETSLRNIVNNAIKFTPENGQIRIIGRMQDQEYCFEVKDSGRGMDEYQIQHLFDMKLASTLGTNKERGHGLGLKLVKGFVELNEGRIEVTSALGSGSTFRLYFPSMPKYNF